MTPLAVDLFCGLGGWADGLLAEGFDVIGFDIERHQYGEHRYPAQLVIQDVLTLHGSQFKDAALIVASPPCQAYSYMAMPWKLAKAKAAAIRADTTGQMLADLNRLFEACFRIQAQASLAAGRHIPMVVENVRGAQPWVGRSRWAFGSFHLWGDVPALMPFVSPRAPLKGGDAGWRDTGPGRQFQDRAATFLKVAGIDFNIKANTGQTSPGFNVTAAQRYRESVAKQDREVLHRDPAKRNIILPQVVYRGGVKHHGGGADGWFGDNNGPMREYNSSSNSRKAASAMIAKIPLPLSRHIAAVFHP